MASPPRLIDGAHVLFYAVLDSRHRHTDATRREVQDGLLPAVDRLAICQYAHDPGVYLFYCNSSWRVMTDTLHADVAEAKQQAEFEYENVSESWVAPVVP